MKLTRTGGLHYEVRISGQGVSVLAPLALGLKTRRADDPIMVDCGEVLPL